VKRNSEISEVKQSNLFWALSPLDIATLFYILFSTIYICLGAAYLENISSHILIRVLIVILIAVLTFLNKKYPSKIVSFFKNLYPLIFLGYFYTETSYMKNILFTKNLDEIFADLELFLWGCQPSIEFSITMPHGWFNEVMNLCYFSYYLLTTLICFVIYFKNRLESYKSIFVVIFSFYLYYIVFDLFPVAGPQYHFGHSETEPPYFFGKIMHYIIINAEEPTGAFPSSHVGIALILSYVAFLHQKRLFYLSLPFVIGICFATVYLKAHYLVDVLAGIMSVPLFIFISNLVYNKLEPLCLQKSKN
jgi:membrane-associated phospholipid phosphatase